MATIREIADTYLERVRQSGPENITALCPFHQDSSPSFRMSTLTGLYICFACGAVGNLRQFLRGMGLPEGTIRTNYSRLIEEAQKAKPKKKDPTKPEIFGNDPLPEEFLGLFSGSYPKSLLDAGFTEETLDFHEVGFDKHHMRITYPIRDMRGNLMGISGRSVEEDAESRYKVYDLEYKVWGLSERHTQKSAYFWGGHLLQPYLNFGKSPDKVVVVEGYKAKMWVWQAGIKDVVALQGAKMSREHKWVLQRLGCPVYLMLDNNETGYEQTDVIGFELGKSLPVHVVQYESEQPDGLTSDSLFHAVEAAKSYYQVLLDQMSVSRRV